MNLNLLRNINAYVKSVQNEPIDILNVIRLDIHVDNINVIKIQSDSYFLKENIPLNYTHNTEYYKNGIISKMYNVSDVSYDYILGYVIFKQYSRLFANNIYFLFSGIDNYDIIKGISKYILEGVNIYSIKYKFITNANISLNKQDLLKGVVDNDFVNTNNITYWKSKIYNKNINCIFNVINPSKNIHILTCILYYALDTFFYKNGILITRIFDTESMTQDYIDYILLFCIIFKNVELFKIPISKNNKISYRYYLMCNKKNKLSNEYNWVSKKLLSIVDSNEKLVLVNPVSLDVKLDIITKIREFYKPVTQDSMTNFINILDMQ
jgi:hypothetical protein